MLSARLLLYNSRLLVEDEPPKLEDATGLLVEAESYLIGHRLRDLENLTRELRRRIHEQGLHAGQECALPAPGGDGSARVETLETMESVKDATIELVRKMEDEVGEEKAGRIRQLLQSYEGDCEPPAKDSGCMTTITVPPPGGTQRPGDCNQDGRLDISDLICLAQILFLGTRDFPCEPGDGNGPGNLSLLNWNGDGNGINISDASYGASFLFGTCTSGPPCPAHVLGTDCLRIAGCEDVDPCPAGN